MYKDKEQQKEANRAAAQRRRDKLSRPSGMTARCDEVGMTKGTREGMTAEPIVIPEEGNGTVTQGNGNDLSLGAGTRCDGLAVTPLEIVGAGEVHTTHESPLVGSVDRAPPVPKRKAKPTFKDLPADVQASIEKHCAENNKGDRADSHSRAAMTERALKYQERMGKRPGQGVSDSDMVVGDRTMEQDSNQSRDIAPLDVYSEQRWTYLQSQGYVWYPSLDRGWHKVKKLIGVPVPGDPAYGETGNNQCNSCGKDTGHKLVVKCLACCSGKVVA